MRLLSAALLAAAVATAGCTLSQRVDQAANGTRDALTCVQARGGDAARAAKSCASRGFYDSPEYKAAYLVTTDCVAATGGDAASAAASCGGDQNASSS